MRSRAELERLIDRAGFMAAESADNGFVCTAADLLAFAAALTDCLPEERVGQCFCADEPFVFKAAFTRWVCEFNDEALPVDNYCWACGAHLGADGVARRNADAGRVERVRQALANWSYFCERRVSHDPTVELRDDIRAALDGPQGGSADD